MNRKPDDEVIGIIRLVRLVQSTNCMPEPGGLFQQDSYFVYLLEQVLIFDQERQKIEDSRARSEMARRK